MADRKIGHYKGDGGEIEERAGRARPLQGQDEERTHPMQTAHRVGHPGILFGFVGEGEFGFFVQD